MADDSLYDEFGNYIGPELSDSDQVRGSELVAFHQRAAPARTCAAAAAALPPAAAALHTPASPERT